MSGETGTRPVMSVNLSPEQVSELVSWFVAIDVDGNGMIDPPEVDIFLRQVFPGAPEELIVQVRNVVLTAADQNNDGKIDIAEFVQLIRDRKQEAVSLGILPPDANQDLSAGAPPQPAAADSNALLPHIISQLTTEEIDMVRDCFIYLDANGDGFVDRTELMTGVAAVVGAERFPDVQAYLDKIFDVADKDQDGCLNLTEFLASFADGPGAVPHEVVLSAVSRVRVRLTDDDIANLQQCFQSIDTNQDGYVDSAELLAALRQVMSGNTQDGSIEQLVTVVMATADTDMDGKLNLSEFIRSFQEDQGVLPASFIAFRGALSGPDDATANSGSPTESSRTGTNVRKLLPEELELLHAAFENLDKNTDGFVDFQELLEALTETLRAQLDLGQIQALTTEIIRQADSNQDGKLTIAEFMKNFQASELMMIPVGAALQRRLEAQERFLTILANDDLRRLIKVFEYLDVNQDGYLTKEEIVPVVLTAVQVSYPELAGEVVEEFTSEILRQADVDQDGRISIEEFVNSFIRGYGVLPMDAVRQAADYLKKQLTQEELRMVYATFKAMDSNGDGFVSRIELRDALNAALSPIGTSKEKIVETTKYILSLVDLDADGKISLSEFVQSFERDDGLLPLLASPASPSGNPATEQQAAPENANTISSPIQRPKSPVATTFDQVEPAPASAVAVVPTPQKSPSQPKSALAQVRSPIVNDVSGVCISDDQLRSEFAKYDKDGSDVLNKAEFKQAYLAMESFGLPISDAQFERDFKRMGGHNDGYITYDEFCIFMLKRSRM